MSILDDTKKKMADCLEHLKAELSTIRTGRANIAMLDKVQVEVYGAQMPLKQVANVTVPEPRQLLVTPFDVSNTPAIGKAIENANVGQVVVDANAVRINVPPMDETTRKKMGKLCHEKGEEAKVSIRNARRDANDHARKQKKDGELTEDELKGKEKKIQELTDQFCKEADTVCEAKEKEVMTI